MVGTGICREGENNEQPVRDGLLRLLFALFFILAGE
jgi:hypothetical protein